MSFRLVVSAGFVLALGLSACGDDDDDGVPGDGGADTDASSGGGSGGKGGSSGKSGGGSGGSSGSTSTGGSSGSTAAGTGGTPGIPMGAACDPSIPTTATCGGTACPAATSPIASFVCSVPCCLPDNTCALRRAYMTDPTDCAPPAQPDPDCPDMMTMGIGGMGMTPMDGGTGGMVLEGCCAPSKLCGVISGADMSCITSSQLLPNLMPGAPCGDEMDGGSETN